MRGNLKIKIKIPDFYIFFSLCSQKCRRMIKVLHLLHIWFIARFWLNLHHPHRDDPHFFYIFLSVFYIFFQFSDVAQVAIIQKYIYIYSQISWYSKYESRKILSTFHIEGNCGFFFPFFGDFTFKHGICDIILFFPK